MSTMNEKTPVTTVVEAGDDVVITMPEKVILTPPSYESPLASAPATPQSYNNANPFDTDMEAMISRTSDGSKRSRTSNTLNRKDCPVWPGRKHWADKAKEAKMKRSFTFLARLTPRQRIIAKILLVCLVVGIAVGVGFGVSKPLGAPIWGKKDD